MCLLASFRPVEGFVPPPENHCRYDMQILCINCGECKKTGIKNEH